MRRCRVYCARAMSNRPYTEIVTDAAYDRAVLRAAGFEVLCPVENEKVKSQPGILLSPKETMDIYWMRDKEMIDSADVMVNMSPHTNSIGVAREHGLMQYGLRRPVASVFPEGKMPAPGSICYYEDFLVTDSILHAAETLRTWWRSLDHEPKPTKRHPSTSRVRTPGAGRGKNRTTDDGAAKPTPRDSRGQKKGQETYRAATGDSCGEKGCGLCARRDIFRAGA